MKKSLKIIRILTVAPIMAFCLFTLTYICKNEYFSTVWQYIYSIFCLSVLPMLAYPLQRFIPGFCGRGREGQRSLAIIFSVIGYVLCCIFGLIFTQSIELWMITVTYLLSGVCIFISSKVFKFKISGHACGVFGPVGVLLYFGLFIPAAIGILLGALVYYASLKSGRHTLPELIAGTVLPIALMTLFILIF